MPPIRPSARATSTVSRTTVTASRVCLLAACLLAAGCASSKVLSIAQASEGRQGYGTTLHKSAASNGFFAVGQVASVVASVDGMWRVDEGGGALKYCEAGDRRACQRVTVEVDGDSPDILAILSPGNLGRLLWLQDQAGGLGSESSLPVTQHRGIWVDSLVGLLHCRLESGGPACHSATFHGDEPLFRIPVGVFVINDTDVAWLAGGDEIYRCEGGPNGPPSCVKTHLELLRKGNEQ